jgi:hypothetical protein
MNNPVNLVNRVKNSGLSVDSLTNRYTAIDAAPHACDTAGNLTRDRQPSPSRMVRGKIF